MLTATCRHRRGARTITWLTRAAKGDVTHAAHERGGQASLPAVSPPRSVRTTDAAGAHEPWGSALTGSPSR